MAWGDRKFRERGRRDYGEGGGLRRAFRRIFVEGDDFFSWSLPLFTIAGVRVRIHLIYVVIIVVEMLKPIVPGDMGYAFKAFFLGAMFLFVLLHEFGHVFACRAVRGEADEILMWPLGGLAMCRPPHRWAPALLTTLGGPAVNLALAAVLACVMVALGAGWGVAAINPINPWQTLVAEPWFHENAAHWKTLLFFAYAANVYMFLFNMLLPMFPMDGGRVLQELLWIRLGYHRSMIVATNTGLALAIITGIVALSTGLTTLFSIALFAGIVCFTERRRLQLLGDFAEGGGMGGGAYEFPQSAQARRDDDRKFQEAAAAQQRQRTSQAELDRILAKIRERGMGSLTRKERNALREETERKRAGRA